MSTNAEERTSPDVKATIGTMGAVESHRVYPRQHGGVDLAEVWVPMSQLCETWPVKYEEVQVQTADEARSIIANPRSRTPPPPSRVVNTKRRTQGRWEENHVPEHKVIVVQKGGI